MPACCSEEKNNGCSPSAGHERPAASGRLTADFPIVDSKAAACCGLSSPPSRSPHERPGYRLWPFVEDFVATPAGPVPRVRTVLNRSDHWGTVGARVGIGRDDYRVAPGLYAVGKPDDRSPVLVTANYKLTFDSLRQQLAALDAWMLVIETYGINVWCAAGKGTFSAREVAARVQTVGLEAIVTHRRLILPQLSANGVSARQVKTLCGFEVVWGPVRAADVEAFLRAGMQAAPAMRTVTFTLLERVTLIPVELNHLGKPTAWLVPLLVLISGIGTGVFSIQAALARGLPALLAYLLAILSGAVVAPVLLPWLPGRAFALKGAGVGVAAGALLSAGFVGRLTIIEMAALTVFIMAVSSYLAMNFTGSTPFTSPTGVEKEMRRAIPAQAAGALVALILWVGAGFTAV